MIMGWHEVKAQAKLLNRTRQQSLLLNWHKLQDIHQPSQQSVEVFATNVVFPQVNYIVESLICRIRAKWIRR